MSGTKRETHPVRIYLGVDVGGTKIQASLVESSGTVLNREKATTPRDTAPEAVVTEIQRVMEAVLKRQSLRPSDLTAMGVAIPGVVDPPAGRIVVTPNMNLSGIALGAILEEHFKVPVVLGNDCNLGALGEAWLGSARNAKSMMSILVGTGIGGGFVRRGKLWRGARESAGEIGHLVMQIGGPQCGCGNHGCFEALASRSAIERDLRTAVAAGRKTVLTELLQGDLALIRSGVLRDALAAGDELVREVLGRAAEILGYACLSVRHLIDPQVIVLGGGVIEACSDYVMPIVEGIIASDRLPGARDGGHVVLSALGDDAVVLGAVALARTHVGRNPFKRPTRVRSRSPQLDWRASGEVVVQGKTYDRDFCVLVDGTVKKRKKAAEGTVPNPHRIEPADLERACKGGPAILFVGSGTCGQVMLSEAAQRYLKYRLIQWETLPTPQAVEAFNQSPRRKAALLHLRCQ